MGITRVIPRNWAKRSVCMGQGSDRQRNREKEQERDMNTERDRDRLPLNIPPKMLSFLLQVGFSGKQG